MFLFPIILITIVCLVVLSGCKETNSSTNSQNSLLTPKKNIKKSKPPLSNYYKKIIKKLKSKGFPHDTIEYIINNKSIIPFLKDGIVTLKEVNKAYVKYNKCMRKESILINNNSSFIGQSDFFIKPVKNHRYKKDMKKEIDNNQKCELNTDIFFFVSINQNQAVYTKTENTQSDNFIELSWSCMRRHKLLPKTYSLQDFKRDYFAKDLDTPNPNNLLSYFATNSHKIPIINKNQYHACANNTFDLPSYTDEYDWTK